MKCESCAFANEKTMWEYECRKRSPHMNKVDYCQDIRGFVPVWPIVKFNDWCGEFASANGLPKSEESAG